MSTTHEAPSRRQLSILSLSSDCLCQIAALLPPKDRRHLAATCTDLRLASLAWFPELALKRLPEQPAEVAQLAAWLTQRQTKTSVALYMGDWEHQLLEHRLVVLSDAPVVCLALSTHGDQRMRADFLAGYSLLSTLELSVTQIYGGFPALRQMRKLHHLRLSADLLELPDALSQLDQLTYLDLNYNRNLKMNGWQHLAPLTRLKELHAIFCSLDQIPAAVAQLTAMSVLHFCCNEIAGGFKHLAFLQRLQRLSLKCINILSCPDLPSALSRLTALHVLDITGCQFSSGWQHFTPLVRLEELSISPGSHLPGMLARLTALSSLSMTGQEVKVEGGWEHMEPLRRLQRLELLSCLRNEVPAELARLTSFTSLTICGGGLELGGWEHLPPASLQHLSLENVPVPAIPAAFSRLTALTGLELETCSCDGSGMRHLWPLHRLQLLELLYCKLPSVPAELSQLTSLTSFALIGNQLEGGWEHLLPLTCLRDMTLMKCGLECVPPEVKALEQRQGLDLLFELDSDDEDS